MAIHKFVICIVAGLSLTGCASTEGVRFQALAQQQALVRDGRAALVSKKQNSLVIIRPAARQMETGRRPVYVVGLFNSSANPSDFRVADISVTQSIGGHIVPLPVVPYEQLVQEERTRQVVSALLVTAAAVGNAHSARQAGFDDPTAAAIAQGNASAQNDAMIASAVATGQANMAALEKGVIKDNTLLPGEWYGGQLHFAPPESDSSGPKTYRITIPIGADVHEIEVSQGAVTS